MPDSLGFEGFFCLISGPWSLSGSVLVVELVELVELCSRFLVRDD